MWHFLYFLYDLPLFVYATRQLPGGKTEVELIRLDRNETILKFAIRPIPDDRYHGEYGKPIPTHELAFSKLNNSIPHLELYTVQPNGYEKRNVTVTPMGRLLSPEYEPIEETPYFIASESNASSWQNTISVVDANGKRKLVLTYDWYDEFVEPFVANGVPYFVRSQDNGDGWVTLSAFDVNGKQLGRTIVHSETSYRTQIRMEGQELRLPRAARCDEKPYLRIPL